MSPSAQVRVRIDLSQIRRNAEAILQKTRVALIAVVKADAYGLGAQRIAETLGDCVDAFYVFDANEAIHAQLHARTGKRTITLLGESKDPVDYLAHHIQPVVWSADQAEQLRTARPVLSLDTGQGRFGLRAHDQAEVREWMKRAEIREAFTHAVRLPQVAAFAELTQGVEVRHAAGSALIDVPEAWFDAVRPGIALYQQAVRVSTGLIEVHADCGHAGYSGFSSPRYGVIRCGYSNGLRAGVCRVNGMSRRILEVGMQSAFIELGTGDSLYDEVVLLGDGLDEREVAREWKCTPQEALLRLAGTGIREYR